MIDLHHGDCLEVMDKLISAEIKIDLIVTDPPYDIKNTKAGGKSELAKSMQGMNNEILEAGITKGFDYIAVLDKMVQLQDKINMY
ncbi:MAG: site-specific DNA-methyltransferase, partial [Candidatus Stahlbacteria bacterium]